MRLKVLVVEDHPIIQKVTAEMLRISGHESTIAVSGEEGVSFFDPQEYDLVLMDIGLPDISGFVATQRIREKEQQFALQSAQPISPVPIVALTAHANQKSASATQAAGIDEWFEKPLTLGGLRDLLDRLHLTPTETH